VTTTSVPALKVVPNFRYRMTKLMQLLTLLVTFLSFWMTVYTDRVNTGEARLGLLWSPVLLLVIFGLYSVITIGYRVMTFNDCEEASKELQQQIGEARADLRSKGFLF